MLRAIWCNQATMHALGRAPRRERNLLENYRDRKKAAINLKRRHLPPSGRLGGRAAFYKLCLCCGFLRDALVARSATQNVALRDRENIFFPRDGPSISMCLGTSSIINFTEIAY